jgi:hypothetical protein
VAFLASPLNMVQTRFSLTACTTCVILHPCFINRYNRVTQRIASEIDCTIAIYCLGRILEAKSRARHEEVLCLTCKGGQRQVKNQSDSAACFNSAYPVRGTEISKVGCSETISPREANKVHQIFDIHEVHCALMPVVVPTPEDECQQSCILRAFP